MWYNAPPRLLPHLLLSTAFVVLLLGIHEKYMLKSLDEKHCITCCTQFLTTSQRLTAQSNTSNVSPEPGRDQPTSVRDSCPARLNTSGPVSSYQLWENGMAFPVRQSKPLSLTPLSFFQTFLPLTPPFLSLHHATARNASNSVPITHVLWLYQGRRRRGQVWHLMVFSTTDPASFQSLVLIQHEIWMAF